MAIARWNPRQSYTKQEEFLMRRLGRTQKLFAFLRAHRHELFDDAFQAELETMYRDTGAGKVPVPPRCWRWSHCCKPIWASRTPRQWN